MSMTRIRPKYNLCSVILNTDNFPLFIHVLNLSWTEIYRHSSCQMGLRCLILTHFYFCAPLALWTSLIHPDTVLLLGASDSLSVVREAPT